MPGDAVDLHPAIPCQADAQPQDRGAMLLPLRAGFPERAERRPAAHQPGSGWKRERRVFGPGGGTGEGAGDEVAVQPDSISLAKSERRHAARSRPTPMQQVVDVQCGQRGGRFGCEFRLCDDADAVVPVWTTLPGTSVDAEVSVPPSPGVSRTTSAFRNRPISVAPFTGAG